MASKQKNKPGDLVEGRENSAAPQAPGAGGVAAFVARARAMAQTRKTGERGRLIFALDATMSRQPTWDSACQNQAEMFRQTAAIGGLDVQLVYFRGFRECRASKWVSQPERLAGLMSGIDCRGGHTQIGKVLAHARKEAKKHRVHALVYVGDCMEENVDDLAASAGELGLLHVPVFVFQEGHEPAAERAFREIARLTNGTWCRFDAGAASQLKDLLSAVAVYAAGGRAALENYSARGRSARLLLEQMR